MSGDRPEKAAAERIINRILEDHGASPIAMYELDQIICDSYAQGPAPDARGVLERIVEIWKSPLEKGADWEKQWWQRMQTMGALAESALSQPQECRSCGKPLIAQAIQVGKGLCLVCLDEQPTEEGPKCTLTGNPCGTDTVPRGKTCPDQANGGHCKYSHGTAPTPAPAAQQEKPSDADYERAIDNMECADVHARWESPAPPAATLSAEGLARKIVDVAHRSTRNSKELEWAIAGILKTYRLAASPSDVHAEPRCPVCTHAISKHCTDGTGDCMEENCRCTADLLAVPGDAVRALRELIAKWRGKVAEYSRNREGDYEPPEAFVLADCANELERALGQEQGKE